MTTIKKLNVLVFPAGSEIGFEIFNALKYNLHIQLFGASGKSDHARFVYDPECYAEDNLYINDPSFFETFNKVLKSFKIDLIFPTHDSIVQFLTENQKVIQAKVVGSSFDVASVAREKRKIYERFRDFDFCTKVYQAPYGDVHFPIFLKPNMGQGGKGTLIARSRKELMDALESNEGLVPCEYLPGEELSVDCFSDRKGRLLFVGPRKRHRVEMGISFNTFSVPLTSEIREIAQTLHTELGFRGAWFFQVKRDRLGLFKLMEFAPRIASTMGLYRQVGINFPLLTVFDAVDRDVEILDNRFSIELDRCLQNRFKTDVDYEAVYIDLDDTIIVRDKVNDSAIRFLYQCKRKKVRLVLLTKHRSNLQETLEKFCISEKLFDEIVQIQDHESKVDLISHKKSIFIDNYFHDRKCVKEKLGIPVFDVDAIDCLLVDY